MKKCLLMLLCMVLVASAGSAFAEEEQKSRFKADIGVQAYYYEYKEPGIMKNEGYFGGLSYSFAYEDRILLGVEGILAYGQVDYTSENSGSLDDNDDFCSETRLLFGVKTFDDVKTQVYPYIGVAYRYLQDDTEGKLSTTGRMGYMRRSQYYYSPIGIRVTVNYANGWSLSPELEYDYFWTGTQESDLGYITGAGDISNDQEEGYGYRASLTLAKKSGRVGYSFQIFYRYWDIDDSDYTTDSAGTPRFEPKNETVEYGFNFSILF